MAIRSHLIISFESLCFNICMSSCLITLAGMAFKMSNRSDDNVVNRNTCLVSDLKGKTFNISVLTQMFPLGI